MGELRLSDYSSDIALLSFLLLVLSALAVPWLEVSVSSLHDALYYFLLPWVLIIPLHEGLHAIVARLFGAKVRFGVTSLGRLIIAPYIAVDAPISARKYAVVSFAPLVLSLTALALAWLQHSVFWALVYVFNTVGMVGDFLTALSLLRMPSDAKVFDDGIALKSDSEMPAPYPGWFSTMIKLAFVVLFVLILIFGRVEVVVEKGL